VILFNDIIQKFHLPEFGKAPQFFTLLHNFSRDWIGGILVDRERARSAPWRRVVVEKPFGTDLASARALNRALLEILTEDQIYCIDHYLGKETVQNILLLRFANGLFEPIWNRNHIDHVQITVAETVNVERRGRFYDQTGALRDMVPNHLFQLLALIAMEPPARFEAERVRNAKAEALAAIRIPNEAEALANLVQGQYRAGRVHDEPVVAYRDAEHIVSGSVTETYVALRLEVDNWRWAGVPFYLRTGKALSARRTEVAIKFKQAPISMFEQTSVDRLGQNFLVLRIQPNEGITLRFNAKVPGPVLAAESVDMTFKYKDHFDVAPSTGYETLIYDCMTGDALHFQRADGVGRDGPWFSRSWTRGRRLVTKDWSSILPARLDQKRQVSCWRAMVVAGA
jgi:glucose-6-phosphate 1-dehydrogenase